MKIWLIYFLFNIHTGALSSDSFWVSTHDTPDSCYTAAVRTGPQKPDKDGNIKIYACELNRQDSPEQEGST